MVTCSILLCIVISGSQKSLSLTFWTHHLLIIFHLLDHIRSRNLSDAVYKFTDLEGFQRFATKLISTKIQIYSEEEAERSARDLTASIASVYRIATSKITLSDINKDMTGLEKLLKHKRRLRSLWQITRGPANGT
jgi:hypothetical protein